jgi:hypothetical protein
MKFAKLILLLLIAFIPCTTKAVPSTDSLMVKVLMLEKAVMETRSDSAKALLLLQKAEVYKLLDKHMEVVNTLSRVEPLFLTDSLKKMLLYKKAFSHFMLRNYQEALFALWDFDVEENYNNEYGMLYLMLMLENERWDDFNLAYEKASRKRNGSSDTLSLLPSLQVPPFLDPDHYAKFSKYLPGLGLIKSGYYVKGFTSLGVQLFLVGIAIYNFNTTYYLTATFTGLMPAYKFYRGGRILTKSMVEKKNQDAIATCKRAGYKLVAGLNH